MASGCVNRDCGTLRDADEAVANRVEMIEHDAVLRHDVRFGRIARDAEVADHWPGIDAPVDAEQRHADVLDVAGRTRPETAVRIAVFRTDARVHHERPEPRNGKHGFLQKRLASRDRQVRRAVADERLGLGRVRRRDDDFRRVRPSRKLRSQRVDPLYLPCAIRRRVRETIPGSEGKHIQEPPRADALDLACDPLTYARARLADDDDAGNGRKRCEPPRQAVAVEERIVVADEQRPHRYQQIPR